MTQTAAPLRRAIKTKSMTTEQALIEILGSICDELKRLNIIISKIAKAQGVN